MIEGDEKTNRDACVNQNILPHDEAVVNWFTKNHIDNFNPDPTVKLWDSRGIDGDWKSLEELGLKEKFVQVDLPADYKIVKSENDHRMYFLENNHGLKIIRCWIKFTHYEFYACCSLIERKNNEE